MPLPELDDAEDGDCRTASNIVMNDRGGFIEDQGTAEGPAVRHSELGDPRCMGIGIWMPVRQSG
ncbi:hypothetical protein H0E82_12230 [Luteimonas sp. SJ-16]|uniref:Uncharacterized protein n=1 Tax=Luteimonas deserti TaxID=2752306 RepID=A0A7Z0QRI7_9GAMM|nr:hypothetical protein [Luteimonas deserti]